MYPIGGHLSIVTYCTGLRLPAVTAGGGSHIITSGDRFMEAVEINDLFEQESPAGQLYVRLKELGIQVEREWWIDEEGITWIAGLGV